MAPRKCGGVMFPHMYAYTTIINVHEVVWYHILNPEDCTIHVLNYKFV